MPGQSGNPGGIHRLRREFDAVLADALMGQDPIASAQELATIAWKAARKHESWAVTLLFQRLAPQPLNVRVSRGEDEHALDYSKLTDEELKTLEGIFARQGLLEGESNQKSE
jgi:hypothetical protein